MTNIDVLTDVDLIVSGGVVITMDEHRNIYNPGFIAINHGKIVSVGMGPGSSFRASRQINAQGMVVLPGLVNSHDHLDQSIYRGCSDERPGSRNRLLTMAKSLTYDRAKVAASLSLLELVHFGVTTTQENHWTHYHVDSTDGVCDAIANSGMRGIVSRGISDAELYNPPDLIENIGDVLADLDRLERKYESEYITITGEPTTVVRCKPDTILAIRNWAREKDKMWHIHLAQTSDELSDALKQFDMGSVQWADHLGVLGPETLAIHCSGLLEEEVDILGDRKVRIAHCPVTQMRGGNMVPPIWTLENKGAIVGIGTDGSGTNNGQNPWEAMKMAIYMQRVQSKDRYLGNAELALEMMTIKAARVLGIEDKVGSLEHGKFADLALFSMDQLQLLPGAMLVNNLVYSSTNNFAETVIVGGQIILEHGVSTRFDEKEIKVKIVEAQGELLRASEMDDALRISRTWPINAP
jgi:5-methylthioadenosine/S-adenosylhomocysteine deaminase